MEDYRTSIKKLFYLSLSVFIFSSTPAFSEEVSQYPSRPITFIQPFGAGASADLSIRLLAKATEKILGQPIVVINKTGGAGSIGTAAIVTSKFDGYTIGNVPTSPMFVVPILEKVPYHPVKDLKMIMQFASFNMGTYVKADSPFKSFKDIIGFAKQNPKKVTYSTPGTTSIQYIIHEQIARKEGVLFTHIPQKSNVEGQIALLGEHIMFGAGDFNYSLFESGQIRVLLISKEERSEEYPKIPIPKDFGYDVPCPMLNCVTGPKGLPEGIAKKLEDAFTKGMKDPTFIKGMKDLRYPIVYRNSKELSDYVAFNYEAMTKALKEIGLTN